jgi:ketosteroid isomerase-like protein
MSDRSTDLLRQIMWAVNRNDPEAFIRLSDHKVEGTSVITGPFGTAYRGHDGIRRYFRDLDDAWEGNFQVEIEALFDLGEHTLSFYVFHGRGRRSGVEVTMPGAVVVRWRNGLVAYFKGYADRDEALRELGVTQEELEPIAP